MSKTYDSDQILENAKALIKLARQQHDDPMAVKMALEVASTQIEREVTSEAHAQAIFNALKRS